MPQLDISTFTPQLVWLAIWFVVLYLLMAKLALPRIARAMEARRRRREDDLARAAQLKAEADEASAAYQKTLAEDTKATLLQFIANCSQKLLDDDTSTRDTPDPACSFCGRHPPSVRLGAGPSVFICNECVDLFSDALKEPGNAN